MEYIAHLCKRPYHSTMAVSTAQILPIRSVYFELLTHDCILRQIVAAAAADNAVRPRYRPRHTSMERPFERVCEN